MAISFLRTKVRVPLFLATILIVANSGCNYSRESAFFQNFSMRELAVNSKGIAGLRCDASGTGGGGGGGIFSRTGGIGGKTHFQSHKSDNFTCRLTADSLSSGDEDQLMSALRQQLENSLNSYHAAIKESGSREAHSFFLVYTIIDIQGRVQVSGQRIGVGYYNLQATLEENNN